MSTIGKIGGALALVDQALKRFAVLTPGYMLIKNPDGWEAWDKASGQQSPWQALDPGTEVEFVRNVVRTAQEVIDEVSVKAGDCRWWAVFCGVAGPAFCNLVEKGPQALEELTKAIEAGTTPFAIASYAGGVLHCRPLMEFENDEEIRKYLLEWQTVSQPDFDAAFGKPDGTKNN